MTGHRAWRSTAPARAPLYLLMGPRAGGPSWCGTGLGRREDHDHRGPHAQGALHANLAPVLLHDRFGAGQADTRAGHVACRGGAIEGAEDMWHLVVRDAHAAVA